MAFDDNWDVSKAPRTYEQDLENQTQTNLNSTGKNALGIRYGQGGAQAAIDAANAREMNAFGRHAVGIDYSGTNASLAQAAAAQAQASDLGMQDRGAVSMLGQQAAGRTPSAAAINAGLGTQNGLSGALQGLASGHTSLAQAAATRQSLMAGAQAQLANLGQSNTARAQEMANANQLYAGAGADYNAQGLGYAGALTGLGSLQGKMVTAQGQQNLAQAQLNQQYAENQEQQKFGIDNTLQSGELSALGRFYGNYQAQNAINNQQADRTLMYLGAGMQSGSSMLAAGSTYNRGSGNESNPAPMSYTTSGVSSGGIMQNQAYAQPNSDERTKEAVMSDADAAILSARADREFGTGPQMSDAEASRLSTEADRMFGVAPRMSDAEAARLSAEADRAFGVRPSRVSDSKAASLAKAADAQIAAMRELSAAGPALRRAGGGDASNGFNTQLTQGAEQAYRAKFGDNSDRDYDLRGAFAAGLTDGARAQQNDQGGWYFPDHLPDTYKKPNHETFSDESQYAPMAPERAGHWNGDTFVPPDQGVLADANRRMAGQPYRYKPEFTPPDEVPGQIHHGFMAQNLEQNPVTATAVQRGPDGMRQVHTNRMLQAVASGVADLQRQMDETRHSMKGKR